MKEIVIGADPFPPYQYIDVEGKVIGFDYEKIKNIIQKMDYKPKFIIDNWSLIEEGFEKKEIDIIFQVQKTEDRKKRYFFSEKLRNYETAIVSHEEYNNITSINELIEKNEEIAVINNYQYGEPIDSIDKKYKVFFESAQDILDAVSSGKVLFGVVDVGVFNYLNKKMDKSNLFINRQINFNITLYVAFHNEKLRDTFDTFLKQNI